MASRSISRSTRRNRDGDQRNHHAHILTTTRQVTPNGLGAKAAVELADRDRAKIGLGTGADDGPPRPVLIELSAAKAPAAAPAPTPAGRLTMGFRMIKLVE